MAKISFLYRDNFDEEERSQSHLKTLMV